MSTLRPYQKQAVEQIRHHAAKGEYGAILQLPTGAGKTVCFCDFLKGAYQKGRPAIMVVRGKSLVAQASERLTREGVPHGVFQGSNTKNTHELIQVCSVDTLYTRRLAPPAQLVVIDECHTAFGDGYEWVLSQYPRAFKIGVSATPHHKRGMRHIGSTIVRTATFNQLVEQGYLVGARYFVPFVPNLRGISKSKGDFNAKELSDRSRDDSELSANAARVWGTHLRGKSTIGYAVSVEHAAVLADALRGVGARVATVVANTKDAERRHYFRELEHGNLDVLMSVGVLTTGVDLPFLQALLICRPTESYNLHIQILGRGTRPHPGKSHFVVYDLAGNLYRHGPIEGELGASLDGISATDKSVLIKTCRACYAVFESGPDCCPACGASVSEDKPRTTGKRLHGLAENDEVIEIKVEAWERELPELVARAREKGLRKGWLYHTLKAKYGDEIANTAWPRIRSLKKWPIKTKAPDPANTPKW